MRLAAQAKGGFYPTPDRVVEMIASLVETPGSGYYNRGKTLRILDPCCGAGEAAALLAWTLADGPGDTVPIETFGVELHKERAEEARDSPGPRPCHGPVRHIHGQRRLRPALSSTHRMTGMRERTRGSSTDSSPTAPATWARTASWYSSSPGHG